MPYGDLDVYVEGALNIKDTSYIGKGSPYCILTVGQQIFKSDVAQEGGSKPYWNKTFSFKIDRGMEDLQIRIYSKNTLRDDDLLGECLIPFAQVFRGGHEVPITAYKVNRSGKHYGEVRLGLAFYAKRRAQPHPQPQFQPQPQPQPQRQPQPPSANEHAPRRPGGGGRQQQQQQQPLYYKSQGLGTDAESPRYNGLNRDVSFKTMSDDDYASSNEGSGRRFASSHGRNGSTASRLSETAAEDFVGAPQDSQPAHAIREQQQQEYREKGPTRAQSLPSAPHHPNNQHQLHGSQSLPPHVAHAPYPQRPQTGQAKQRPVMRPHVEAPLWPPRGKQHDECNYDDEEDRYSHQDRGIESLSPGVTQDSSMSQRDGNGICVAVPFRLSTSFQDMGSRADFSFAEEPSPSPKQSYPNGISGANDDGVATAIEEVGKLTLVAHDEEEEESQVVEETATASLPAAIVIIAKDEARLNNDGVAVASVTPDDDGPLYKSFRRRGGGQATKTPSQVVELPRASQSSKLGGESDEVESQSSHHSRQSSLSQRDRYIPHEQATSDRHVDMESTQYTTFGEDLPPNGYNVDQLPIHMRPRLLSTTHQGSTIITDPQHSQLPLRPPNVSRGGPNLGYGRGGQATKNPSKVVESLRASQSSKLGGESDEVESQSSHHSRQSSLSQRDRCVPHEQATTSDRDVDMESTQYNTCGEDLPPNGYNVDQLPIHMRPRDLSTTHQGSTIITDPQHSQLPMRPPNVSRGGPNPGYGRGGLPQLQGNGGPPSMRQLGRGRGVRPEAAMIRPPLEHNRYGMDVGQQGFAQCPPGNMLPNVMHSAQGPRRRPQRPLVTNQQGFRPMSPQVQNHQPTGPMQMRPGVRPPPMFCESDLQPAQAGKNVPNQRVLQQAKRGVVGVQEAQDADSDVDSCGSRTSKRSDVSRDSPRSTMSSGLVARVGPPLPLKPKFALEDASKKDGQGLGKSVLQVQVEVEGNGGEQETSSTQPIKFIQENNGMSSTEQGLDTDVSGESTHHEFERTLVMEAASQVDNAEVALQDLPSNEQNNRPDDDHKHNREVHIEDAQVDFQETEGLEVSYAESFAPQENLEHEDDDTAINEVDIVFPTEEDNYDGTTMATTEGEVYAQVVDADEQAAYGFEFSASAICISESPVECQDAYAQKHVNGGSDSSHSDDSSHDAKAQQQQQQQQHKKGRRKKDKAISHDDDYRDLSPPKHMPRRFSQVANVHPHYVGAEQNDRVTSWLQESNGDDSMPPPYNTYQNQQGQGRGRDRGQVGPHRRGVPPPSNNPQYDEQSYHPYYDFQPSGGGQYYDEPHDEAMAYPQVQYNTQERDMAASVSRAAVVDTQLTDGKSKMAKKMKGVMKNLTNFGKATIPILAPIGTAITGEVMKQTRAMITEDISGQGGGQQGFEENLSDMIVDNATHMLLQAAVAPHHHQQPVGGGRGGAPMRGQAPMMRMPPGQGMSPARGMAPTMRGEMMPLGYGGPRPMARQPRPQAMGGYPRAPQMGGYPRPPQMGGQPRPPQMGGFQRPPQMGGQPRPPTYYQGEAY